MGDETLKRMIRSVNKYQIEDLGYKCDKDHDVVKTLTLP